MILIWIVFAVLTAIAAEVKGRNPFGWFFLGVLFGAFALIAVLVMPKVEKPQ
ncbi:MAG: hypothetical protein ACE5FM_08365 [Methyloligellaceae bacterium]